MNIEEVQVFADSWLKERTYKAADDWMKLLSVELTPAYKDRGIHISITLPAASINDILLLNLRKEIDAANN